MKRYGLYPELHPLNDWVTLGTPQAMDDAQDWVYLGRLAEYGAQPRVRFSVADEKVVAIFGKRGQGKSFTLGVLLEALSADGPSSIGEVAHSRAVLLLDPLNIFQWIDIPLDEAAAAHSSELQRQVRQANDWGLTAVPLNATIFYPAGEADSVFRPGAVEFRLGVSEFSLSEWSLLLGFDTVRDVPGQLLSELYAKVTQGGWEDVNGSIFGPLPRPTVGDYMVCLARDVDLNSGIYAPETLRAVTQRLRAVASRPVFSGTGTPLTELLCPGRISVLLLNALPDDLRHVVVGVLVRQILGARARASAAQKDLALNSRLTPDENETRRMILASAPPKSWIVVDEAQDLIPAAGKTAATEPLVKLVKEGRNFGLSFVLTTQQPRAVDSRVLSQVETFVVHRLVSDADIEHVQANFKCAPPSEIRDSNDVISMKELVRDLEVGQALISDTHGPRCALVAIRARVGAHGGFEA